MSAPEHTPIFNAPDVVKWIAGATLLAHVVRELLPAETAISLMVDLAFIPGRYGAEYLEAAGASMLLLTTPVTYMFVHGDFTHLLVNVLLFLAFGAAIGRRMGARPFMLFYIGAGVVGAAVFWLFNIGLVAPVIGASGAVAGMVGAVCRLGFGVSDPRNSMPFHSRNSALGFVVVWLVLNFFFGMLPPDLVGAGGGGIAWETHLGGFVFGFIAIRWFDGRGRPANPFDFEPPTHT